MQNTRQQVHPGNTFSVRVVPKWRFDQFLPSSLPATGFFPLKRHIFFNSFSLHKTFRECLLAIFLIIIVQNDSFMLKIHSSLTLSIAISDFLEEMIFLKV